MSSVVSFRGMIPVSWTLLLQCFYALGGARATHELPLLSSSAPLLTGIFALVLWSFSVFPFIAGTLASYLAVVVGTGERERYSPFTTVLGCQICIVLSLVQSSSLAVPRVSAGLPAIYPLNNYLLSTYHIPETGLDIGDMMVRQIELSL